MHDIERQVADLMDVARPTPVLPAERRTQALALMAAGRRARRAWRWRLAAAAFLVCAGLVALLPASPGPRVAIAQLPRPTGAADCSAGPGLEVAVDPLVAADPKGLGFGWSPDGSWIIYPTQKQAKKLHPTLLWKLAADGKRRDLLMEEDRPWLFSPQVTGDGKRAIYFDGKHVKTLVLGAHAAATVPGSFAASHVTCSPDGKWIAFARSHGNDVESGPKAAQLRGLWKWPVAGGKPIRIAGFPAGAKSLDDCEMRTPRWSPDGRWIAFVQTKANRSGQDVSSYVDDVFVVRPDGSGLRKVISLHTAPDGGAVELGAQCWSPDSKRLTFVWTEAGGRSRWPWGRSPQVRGVMVLEVATGTLTAAVPPRAFDSRVEFASDPSWSPKDDHVAFSVARPDEDGWHSDIYVVSTRTGAMTRVAEATKTARNVRPLWSPQGTSLLYARYYIKTTGYVPAQQEQELWVVQLRERKGRR